MGPNSNQLQLQLQLRVRLATADCECGCDCDCCNAHACNQCCKHLFLWLQQRGRAQQQQQSSQPACCLLASNFVAQPKFVACLNIVLLASCLAPVPYPRSSASAAGHSCHSRVAPALFAIRRGLHPPSFLDFRVATLRHFIGVANSQTGNQQLQAGNWKLASTALR